MNCSSKKLLILTLAYIYIPVAVFLIGFTAFWVWFFTLIAVGFFGYKMYKDYANNLGDDVVISWPSFAVVISVIAVICVLIGYGGIFPQSGDWYKHNAVLHDLINKPWPVYYTKAEESMLTYYLGQYLVPALVGKQVMLFSGQNEAVSFNVTEMVMALWGFAGICLVFLNLVRITVADTTKKQFGLAGILMFFSGALPLAQLVCFDVFGENMYSLGSHHWLLANGLMIQYRSNLVMLRWVYPQVIVVWLIVTLFMENSRKFEHYVILLLPLLLFGTFSVVITFSCAVVMAVYELITSKERLEVIKRIFSLSNIVTALTLGIVLFTYFLGYIQVEKPEYMNFHTIEISFPKIITIFLFDLFMFGIYSICVYKEQRKNVLFYAVNAMLMVIPFFTMGVFNDWVMGTSIPGLFIIMVFVLQTLYSKAYTADAIVLNEYNNYRFRCAGLVLMILIGGWYPLMEIKENVMAYEVGDNTWDGYGSLESYSDRSSSESEDMLYNYYTYDLEGKFFYEYLAANKISEEKPVEGKVKTKQASVSGIYFDTYISITTYDDTPREVLDEALNKCEEYELIFSRTNPESELYRINNRIDNEATGAFDDVYQVQISDDLRNVFSAGLKYANLTDGKFNIALGALTELWDFQSREGVVPPEEEINNALEHTNYVTIFLHGNFLYVNDPGMKFDLGGIAKGYIANCLRDFLIENGTTDAVIALGGNVICIGDKGDGGYTVGVQKPYAAQGEALTSIKVADTSVVSSGVYERYFDADGVRYHHILNPVTGYSANTDIAGVTVVCNDSMKADIVSTTVLMLGKEYGMDFLDKLNREITTDPVAEVIFVDENGKLTYWNYDE